MIPPERPICEQMTACDVCLNICKMNQHSALRGISRHHNV